MKEFAALSDDEDHSRHEVDAETAEGDSRADANNREGLKLERSTAGTDARNVG
eukprot:CAMPEP_0204821342 /NCGR_PEP_ID=MMETSP1018-20131115/8966_1 /ASSEMBLY_ACC=CAM_ASM_000518 /TAXON_ID=46462 /ORGANISM="Anophryoides haemophila, Strain AH6" /LENGTH=52 /DNA_ID=CAMNT_0051927283 /DNA_START=616 /DNA_END=774 /DNA_ORIENTATION=+